MGTYNYMLSTKTRKLAVIGEDRSIDVNLIIWGYKDGWGMPNSSPTTMRKLSRCETTWSGRNMPQYVMSEHAPEGAAAGRDNWPVHSFAGCKEPWFSENYVSNYGMFVGYVRAEGKRLKLERWHNMVIPLASPTDDASRATVDEIKRKLFHSGLFSPNNIYTSTHYKSEGRYRECLVISTKTLNDMTMVKMAVSGLIAQVAAPEELPLAA